MSKGQHSVIQRVRYSDGQVLAARDLQADADYEARLRGLHIRAVHNTWGVALGYTLELSNDERQVMVGPGLAYDCWGRELLLADTISLDGPECPADGDGKTFAFDLVIRSRDVAAQAALRNRETVCGGGGVGLAEEHPAFRWVLAGVDVAGVPPLAAEVRLGEDVPLCRVALNAAGALRRPDLSVRRNARPLLRPHVAFGVTRPGELKWDERPFGREAVVDTGAGGFSTPPFYFATLAKNPWFGNMNMVGPFVSIAQPHRTQFRLRLLLAASGPQADSTFFNALWQRAPQASVFWIGVEPVTRRSPAIDLNRFFTLAGSPVQEPEEKWSAAIGRLRQAGLIVE